MVQATVRAGQFGANWACSHVLGGSNYPVGEAVIEGKHLRLCQTCTTLAIIPGGLFVEFPRATVTARIDPLPEHIRQYRDGA